MIKIKTVKDKDTVSFSKKIAKLLMKNWETKGNIAINNKSYIYQMLIKTTAGNKKRKKKY